MDIKKVIVVHKTHLDIGFTDSAENVMHKYLETFIPGAVKTARECNRDGKRNFVWTVGSYLIERYLKEGGDPDMLVKAIEDGCIVWHGLPLTTHTELMDGRLFEYGLSISKRLDERYHRHTIAAKMTDVPSHTHAMVPYLAKAGIKYLHIGINGSSKLVRLPPLCRLRYGEDEIVLDYAALYGASSVCGDTAMEFAHTPDNSGPPSPESVAAEMERLREKYPGAEIASGTMDEFAQVVLEHIDELPVVTEELGDTWIHGVATDPYKTAAYYELLRLRDEWEKEEPEAVDSPAWRDFCGGLLMVCEHSWGRDVKRWLSDWRNWEKQDFYRAREGSQPGYLEEAVAALPEKWRQRAIERLDTLRPKAPAACAKPTPDRSFEIGGHSVTVDGDGTVNVDGNWLGRLVYEVYSAKTVFDNLEKYNRDLEHTRVWAEGDFCKPGLDRVPDLRDEAFAYAPQGVEREGNTLRLWLKATERAAGRYGAPRAVTVEYAFGEDIGLELKWFDKDESRIPEGLFFGFGLGYEKGGAVRVEKLSLPVDPYNVREGGNRKLHASPVVEGGSGAIRSLHAPLLSVGGRHLYDEDEEYGSPDRGMWYLLHNNRWGTNFPLWYGENALFRFKISINGGKK